MGMGDGLTVLIIAAVFLIAGLIKGIIGFGLPTIVIGLLALMMIPAEAAALVIVPSLVTNVWQGLFGPGFLALLRRLWPLLVCMCLATWIGAGIMSAGKAPATMVALGVALAAYALFSLVGLHFRVSPRGERWLSPVMGITTGLITAATGVFVFPSVPYIQALAFSREWLVQALGIAALVSTIALAAGLMRVGAFESTQAAASLLALAPTLAGVTFGGWIRGRVDAGIFRVCFLIGLLALGIYFAFRAAF